ncbi:hypothetical protein TPA0598_04_03640 [Streptomyces lydicamycinicus]|uniref:Uncharacterized protein n=1 Tax=Streptomyces lydicamycinicus TaxID=1546107 RepID=A0A0P4R6I3_9ACTN|nr:hypothetical protein [Streptomyces lydicamycinicus]GAO08728.1 hypothetical protein TPA0598_04_03640 [Streptomyces lydicamycinicus]
MRRVDLPPVDEVDPEYIKYKAQLGASEAELERLRERLAAQQEKLATAGAGSNRSGRG